MKINNVRLVPALVLFLGSYFPLAVILLLQDIEATSAKQSLCLTFLWTQCELPRLANPSRSVSLFIATALCLVGFFATLRLLKPIQRIEVTAAKPIPNELINYVFPYVVSFLGLELGNAAKFWGFIFFLTWMFAITYRSGQILMNPVALVAGWQLYEVEGSVNGHRRSLRAFAREDKLIGRTFHQCYVQGVAILKVVGGNVDDSTDPQERKGVGLREG
jgi:hypothetical protein